MTYIKTISILLMCAAAIVLTAGERVVSLSPALTELVCALDRKEVLIARSSACDHPREILSLPIAGKFGQPEVERIAALKPSRVITNDLINPAAADKFRALGIKVDWRQIRDLEDYQWWVEHLGKELKSPEKMKELLKEIAEFREYSAELEPLKQRVLWVVYDQPLMAAGRGSLPDTVLRYLKCTNLAGKVNSEYFKCSMEWVLANQPEVLIWALPGEPDKGHRFWGKLEAVKRQRVVIDLHQSAVQRPGPRWIRAMRALRKKLKKI